MFDPIFFETHFGNKDTTNHSIDTDGLMRRLQKPKGKIDVVMDTDTFNEVDDQFALSYMIRSDEKLNVKAIYAAPFHNQKSDSPEDGMQKSFKEIMSLLTLIKREDLKENVFKGAIKYLSSEKEAVESDAAHNLAQRAMQYSEESPLYVIAIGAITNIASAILINPEIINKIVVVWLGGNSHDWPLNIEFNMHQDVAAARVVFECGVALVQLPCIGVVSNFTVSGPEIRDYFLGKNELCDYLANTVFHDMKEWEKNNPTWTRVIWDVTAVAWLLDEDFTYDTLVPSPIPEYSGRYSFDKNRHLTKYVYAIKRDFLLGDLVKKLTK